MAPKSISCAVKVRSTRPPAAAEVELYENGTAEVRLLDGGDTISPGQACVFYETGGTRVLGGGWIQRQAAGVAQAPLGRFAAAPPASGGRNF